MGSHDPKIKILDVLKGIGNIRAYLYNSLFSVTYKGRGGMKKV
jgi:hypothetical protein